MMSNNFILTTGLLAVMMFEISRGAVIEIVVSDVLDLFETSQKPRSSTLKLCENNWEFFVNGEEDSLFLNMKKLEGESNPSKIAKLVISIRNFDYDLGTAKAFDELIIVSSIDHTGSNRKNVITRGKLESRSNLLNDAYGLSLGWKKYISAHESIFTIEVTCESPNTGTVTKFRQSSPAPSAAMISNFNRVETKKVKLTLPNLKYVFQNPWIEHIIEPSLSICGGKWVTKSFIFSQFSNKIVLHLERDIQNTHESYETSSILGIEIRDFSKNEDSKSAYVGLKVSKKSGVNENSFCFEFESNRMQQPNFVFNDCAELLLDMTFQSSSSVKLSNPPSAIPSAELLKKIQQNIIPRLYPKSVDVSKLIIRDAIVHGSSLKINAIEIFENPLVIYRGIISFCGFEFFFSFKLLNNNLVLTMARRTLTTSTERKIVKLRVGIRNYDVPNNHAENAYHTLIDRNDLNFDFIDVLLIITKDDFKSKPFYVFEKWSKLSLDMTCESLHSGKP